ncbi:MAG: glycosyltransferase [Clostridia bacterium]|nr:glycosyltransferase [Clostridia bacterium]
MMKIVHLCFLGPFTENWSYQENLITKHQALNGHEVTILTSCYKHTETGELIKVSPCSYTIDNGIKVIRIKNKKSIVNSITLLKKYRIKKILESIEPDFIFCHGIGCRTYLQLRSYYRKNLKCKIVADNHIYLELEKYGKSLRSKLSDIYIRKVVKMTDFLFSKYYYITPSCFDVASINWNIKKEKLEFLPLGFDDTIIDISRKTELRQNMLTKYGLNKDSIIVVTGGKINEEKNIHYLIKHFVDYYNKYKTRIVLFIFGSYADENIKSQIEKAIDNKHIFYLGFLNQEDISELFLGSDVAIFPGGQSVLWQHAIGCGVPLFIKKWPQIEYLNISNNVYYINDIEQKDFYDSFLYIDSDELSMLKCNALSDKRNFFSYCEESKKVLDIE